MHCCASSRVVPRFPTCWSTSSQVGVGAGLEEKLFQPSPEVKKDFYAELPIKIKLTGSYHQMGQFVSGIAALPRIVTLDGIAIKPDSKDAYDYLSFELDREDLPLSRRRRSRRREGQDGDHAEAGRLMGAKTRVMHMFSKTKNRWLLIGRSLPGGECAVRMYEQGRRARTVHLGHEERAGRPCRAAAGAQALRDLRVRIGEPAFAVHAWWLGWRFREPAPGFASQPASSSNSFHSIPCAWSARCDWRTAPTAWSRRKTAWCIACCPVITWDRTMAGHRNCAFEISVVEIVADGLGGYMERPASLALN